MNRKRIIDSLFQSDGSQWHFLSGLVLGLAGNLIISALAPVPRPVNTTQLVAAGLLLIASSGCFSSVGWLLARLEEVAKDHAELLRESQDNVKSRLTAASHSRLVTIIICGALLAVISILILF